MKPWVRYVVTGHECYNLPRHGAWRGTVFFASSLQTAQAFQRYWGGDITRT